MPKKTTITQQRLAALRERLPEGITAELNESEDRFLLFGPPFSKTGFVCVNEDVALGWAHRWADGEHDEITDAVVIAVDSPSVEEEVEQRLAVRGREVYDAEADEWVPVSREMEARESMMRQAWELSKHLQCAIVKTVFDEGLYLAAGYDTKREYCEEVLGIDRSTAHRMYQVAERFAPFLPDVKNVRLLGDGSPDVATLQRDSEPESAISAEIQSTSFSALYKMTALDDELLDVLLKGETLTLDDGRTVDLKALKDASVRQAGQMVKQLKDEYRARLQRDQERANQAEAERDVYKERLDAAEAELQRAREIERQWGPVGMEVEGQLAWLKQGRDHLGKLSNCLDHVRTYEPGDIPPTLQREILAMVHSLNTLVQDFADRMAPITAQF